MGANCCSNEKVAVDVSGRLVNTVEAHGNLGDNEKLKAQHAPDETGTFYIREAEQNKVNEHVEKQLRDLGGYVAENREEDKMC